MRKIVNSWNEWDPLKRVVVGRPEGTHVYAPEPGAYSHQPEGGFPVGTWGKFPQEMVDAANEQMDHFVRILEKRGILLERVDRFFGIDSAAEATAYFQHPVLGARLRECVDLVLGVTGRAAIEIFGATDAMKFRSSLTLFAAVAPGEPLFQRALDQYFDGEPDSLTMAQLRLSGG